MKIALVSCTKLKQTYSCSAREMYIPSTLYSKAIKYIEQRDYDNWLILSAKYGLLQQGKMIDPYDLTLNNMKSNEIKEWSEKVLCDIIKLKLSQIDFYCGDKYRKYLIPLLEQRNIKCNIPLKGKGIGEQLQFYTQNT
jgi:hypothetical protein